MTLSDLRKMWAQTEQLPMKDKRKAYRTATHMAVELGLNSNLELSDIDFCADVIKTCLPALSYPTAAQNKLTKIYQKKLKLMGIDDPDPVILSKKSGHVGIDSGTLMIADPDLLDDEIEHSGRWPQIASEGRAYFIATGGDGMASAQIRVIDFPFPSLSVKETRFGRDQSDTRIIHVPSGNIVVSDPVYWDDPESSMAGNVEPGYYQVSVFVFEIPGKVFSYYFVLCRSDGPHTNTTQDIQELY
ncbi:MAG TPA: hypothetical protein VET88_13440 [Gammaproteobacteria bacterium]|nr:hypothetical protein [Gammaproteobacteria bacterium]